MCCRVLVRMSGSRLDAVHSLQPLNSGRNSRADHRIVVFAGRDFDVFDLRIVLPGAFRKSPRLARLHHTVIQSLENEQRTLQFADIGRR